MITLYKSQIPFVSFMHFYTCSSIQEKNYPLGLSRVYLVNDFDSDEEIVNVEDHQ